MGKNLIAFDMDGVLVDLEGALDAELSRYGIKQVNRHLFKIKTVPELPEETIGRMFWNCYLFHERIKIYPGARELFETLYALSQEPIKIVTARPYNVASATHTLIQRFCQVPYILCHDDGIYGKAAYLSDEKFFVEDRRQTAIELGNKGYTVLVPRREWNCGIKHHKVFYINGINQLIPYAKKFVKTAEAQHMQRQNPPSYPICGNCSH